MNRYWTMGLLLPALAVVLVALNGPTLADEKDETRFTYRTAYQPDGLLRGKVVTITGTVNKKGEGKGTVSIDPNRCTLDEFGNRQACTKLAGPSYEVKFKPVRVDEKPARMALDIEGVKDANLRLAIIPGEAVRLLVLDEKGNPSRIVTLETVPTK